MDQWLDDVVAERAGSTGDDLISVLLRAEMEGGALDAGELRGFVFTLLVAGSITIAYLIGSTTVALASDPALLARARRHPELIARRLEARIAIEELLVQAPRLELAGDITPMSSLVFRGPTAVPLVFA